MSKPTMLIGFLIVICTAGLLYSHVCIADEKSNEELSIVRQYIQSKNETEQSLIEFELEAQAKQKIAEFASTLKQTLKSAVAHGGIGKGVEVCSSKAPEIAAAMSTEGWLVARTSLKTRNQSNNPDEWELQTLKQFEKRYKDGEDINELVSTRYEDDNFRLMKAIPTGPMCLACHGSSVDEKTLNKINTLYPNDQAIGFSSEDLRGAFSITKTH